jgi:hypothetical protein
VRDGILFAQNNRPAVALVTTAFWSQGDFVARSAGMPDIPRLELPHPVSGTGAQRMAEIADEIAPAIVRALWSATTQAP